MLIEAHLTVQSKEENKEKEAKERPILNTIIKSNRGTCRCRAKKLITCWYSIDLDGELFLITSIYETQSEWQPITTILI